MSEDSGGAHLLRSIAFVFMAAFLCTAFAGSLMFGSYLESLSAQRRERDASTLRVVVYDHGTRVQVAVAVPLPRDKCLAMADENNLKWRTASTSKPSAVNPDAISDSVLFDCPDEPTKDARSR